MGLLVGERVLVIISVNWVKEQAQVSSWGTEKDEFESLAEFGQVWKSVLEARTAN